MFIDNNIGRELFRHIYCISFVIFVLVIMMKKILFVILFALGIGSLLAYFVFSRDSSLDDEMVSVKAFQVGAFTSYDNAIRVAERNNGIVVSDEGVYRVYVSILSDDKAIEKMRHYYDDIGLNYYLKEIVVSKSFLDSIKSSEELLIDSDREAYKLINLSVLSEYKEML